MILKGVLRIASLVVLLAAAGCDNTRMPTEPAQAFTGTWVGVKRLVSCTPVLTPCEQPVGSETYFYVDLNQQGDAATGSVLLSKPGPLALPYGFPIRGQISPSGELSFVREFVDVREPMFSGNFTIKTSFRVELIGRMTQASSEHPANTVVWEIVAFPQ